MFTPSPVTNENLLDYFALCPVEGVRWRTVDEGRAAGMSKARLAKLAKLDGRPAGNRLCYGRGAIVMCSGHQLLTVDIRAALENGYFWPWDIGAPLGHCTTPPRYTKSVPELLTRYGLKLDHVNSQDGLVRHALHLAVKLDHGALTWRTSPHESKPEGSHIAGTPLSAPRGRFLSIERVAFLFDDVKHLFLNNRWPWEADLWD